MLDTQTGPSSHHKNIIAHAPSSNKSTSAQNPSLHPTRQTTHFYIWARHLLHSAILVLSAFSTNTLPIIACFSSTPVHGDGIELCHVNALGIVAAMWENVTPSP